MAASAATLDGKSIELPVDTVSLRADIGPEPGRSCARTIRTAKYNGIVGAEAKNPSGAHHNWGKYSNKTKL